MTRNLGKKFILTLLSSSLMTASFSTLAANVPDNVTLAKEQHLVRGNGAEPTSLDPSFVDPGMPADIIATDMFEGFVIEDSQGNIVPAQAKSWTISPNGKTITFTLRDNLIWSNDTPLTASDFVYSWKRGVDPNTGNSTSYYFTSANVLNADQIIAGKMSADQLGIRAVDNKTVEVKLSKPTPYFISLMSVKTFVPLPQHQIEKFGDSWTKSGNIVTNGAFILSKWVANEYVEVVRNPNYWDNKNTVLNRVTYLGLESQNAELTRYQAGEVDMTNRVQLEQYQRLLKDDPSQIKSLSLLGSYLYSFNTTEPPFDNQAVRQALTMSVDRDILVHKITGQGELPAVTAVPTIIPSYQNPTPHYTELSKQQRLEKAKALLTQAGYSDENPLEFTLNYNTSENHKKIAIVLAAMWKPLGVKVHLENMEWNAYVSAKSLGNFQMARSWAFGDYSEPSSILSSFTCEHVQNESGYCNKKFDQLMDQASTTTDQSQRYQLFTQAEALLVEDTPIIPLYHYTHTRIVRNTLGGFPENNPKGNIYAKDLYFIEK
ncbi:peptide ABC transporter substrate-binding protein [Vibrio sp. SS-MA-C1-2]|uniref:peptide ABC transporter substrate-binding protein n=1 Tax=Vibrio sp. SS-MA-C1-2 TaxID=2908646 RepID=UPI001F17B769|nr:peptide ABC transporter substrate-binding protein [Vibrio sp. SS-MA-C1-2]UJF20043.1 peptide ABC transporter substrate-binding protein [Vibrio sp. SS-MA-C1-2]